MTSMPPNHIARAAKNANRSAAASVEGQYLLRCLLAQRLAYQFLADGGRAKMLDHGLFLGAPGHGRPGFEQYADLVEAHASAIERLCFQAGMGGRRKVAALTKKLVETQGALVAHLIKLEIERNARHAADAARVAAAIPLVPVGSRWRRHHRVYVVTETRKNGDILYKKEGGTRESFDMVGAFVGEDADFQPIEQMKEVA